MEDEWKPLTVVSPRWEGYEKKESDPKTKPVGVESSILGNLGRGERIRTSGLCVPNAALYQAKLHPENTRIVPVDD